VTIHWFTITLKDFTMPSDNQAPDQESTGAETEADMTPKSTPVEKRRGWFDIASSICTLFIFIVVGIAGIAATLSGRSNSYVGGDVFSNIWLLAFTIVATAYLTWYVAFKYNSADPIRRHLLILAVAVSINIFLAISVWVVIANIHPAVSPHKAGLMVWWNLSDAIPFINVNSVLDWRQPLTGYSVQVGWLFLLQRVVVILTLLRVIQLLVARWMHQSKQGINTATTGLGHAEQPTDRSGDRDP
jgi:hypothetical protein